jgi:hypothetical protein
LCHPAGHARRRILPWYAPGSIVGAYVRLLFTTCARPWPPAMPM